MTVDLVEIGRKCTPEVQARWLALQSGKGNPYPVQYQGMTVKAEILIREVYNLTGCDVLDIGCNSGFYSLLTARVAKSVVGADVDSELIERANEAKEYFENEVYSVHNLRFVHGNFTTELRNEVNAVIASCVLYHLGDANVTKLQEFLRCGVKRVILQARPARAQAFERNPKWGRAAATTIYNGLYSVEDSLAFLRDCGFDSVRVSGLTQKFYSEYYPVIYAERL